MNLLSKLLVIFAIGMSINALAFTARLHNHAKIPITLVLLNNGTTDQYQYVKADPGASADHVTDPWRVSQVVTITGQDKSSQIIIPSGILSAASVGVGPPLEGFTVWVSQNQATDPILVTIEMGLLPFDRPTLTPKLAL